MQKRKTLLIVGLLATLCASIAAPVYAAYATSIIYSDFNSTTWTNNVLDKEYTTMTADIDVRLAIVTNQWAKFAFTNQTSDNDATSDPSGIILVFNDAGTVTAYYMVGATEVEIGTGTYTDQANITSARLVLSGGKVSIYADYGNRATQQTLVNGFSFSEGINTLRVKGTNETTTTGGYAQVDVNVGAVGIGGNIIDTMSAYIPIIVLFAMLGMVLGLLKKFGKF